MPLSQRQIFANLLLALGLGAAFVPAGFAADQCAPAKAKVECNKKAGCAWNGKACAAKPAGKSAGKAAKPAAKTAAKPGKPAAGAKKPEVKPPTTTPEPPVDEEMPAGDGEAEDF